MDDKVVLRFFDTARWWSAGDAGLQRVELRVADREEVLDTSTPTTEELRNSTYTVALKKLAGRPNAELLELRVFIRYRNGDSEQFSRFFRVSNSFETYDGLVKPLGLWVPVGLFGTNLAKTPDGIPITAMPVGVAMGGRLNTGTEYVGISGFSAWAIQRDRTDGSSANSNSFNMSGAALGLLIDIDNYFYVGAACGVDFVTGHADP